MTAPQPLTILFGGGGTGGHLFPALAIAEQALLLRPRVRVRFLCSERPLDAAILREEQLGGARVDFEVIPAKPFGLEPGALVRFFKAWGAGVKAARAAIQRAKAQGDVHVVSGGGFVAAPVVRAARAERVPVLMLNLDAVPGLANRWIAGQAQRIVTTTPVGRHGWQLIPPIVRAAALAPGDVSACRRMLRLEPGVPTLFVTGASQGAQSINGLITALAAANGDLFRGWQVVHQTGKPDNAEVEAAYRAAEVRAVVFGFRKDLGVCWGAADLAVSRAGAGSVAEAWANRVPTVFMPYPYHKDQHQKLNALPLVEAGGAVLAEDLIEVARNVEAVGPMVVGLMGNAARREAMQTALTALGPVDGARRVAGMM